MYAHTFKHPAGLASAGEVAGLKPLPHPVACGKQGLAQHSRRLLRAIGVGV